MEEKKIKEHLGALTIIVIYLSMKLYVIYKQNQSTRFRDELYHCTQKSTVRRNHHGGKNSVETNSER